MNSPRGTMAVLSAQRSFCRALWTGGLTALVLLTALPVRAANEPVPWECSNYDGAARTRCLSTLVELQRDRIGQLESKLQAQQGEIDRLRNQIDRQAIATSELQKRLSERPAPVLLPPPYPYPYVYPPRVGLGIYLGRPWIYGPSHWLRPYRGFGLHRSWGRRF